MNAYFPHLLFGITLLLSASLIGETLLRRRTASLRHSVLVASLIGVLLVPMLLPLLPHWSLAILETRKSTAPAQTASKISEKYQTAAPSSPTSLNPSQTRLPAGPTHSTVATISEAKAARQLARSPRLLSTPFEYAGPILLGFWAVGSGLMPLRFVLSIRAAGKIVAKTMPWEDELLKPIARRLGIRRPVVLRQSEVGIVPFTLGVRKPIVVLPETANRWTTEERRAVLTHELGHIARWDVLWQRLAEFCCVVYWFHPLVWLAAWRLRVERELACDDLVVLAGEEPPMYAAILLRLAAGLKNTASRRHALGYTVAMARHHEMKRRIAAIVDPKLLRKPLGRIGSLVLLLLAAVGIAAAAMLSPTEKPEPPKTDYEIDKEKKLAIAVDPDAPLVSLRGKVSFPDGSPVSECRVDVFSVAFTYARRFSSAEGKLPPSTTDCATSTRGCGGGVKKDGTFQIDNAALPGSNVVLTVCCWNKNKRFVSKPLVCVARENREPLNITLEEGIPVHGKITYENDSPAANRGLNFEQQLEPILGADIPVMKELFRSSLWAAANNAGEYEIFLTPGDYAVLDRQRQKATLKIEKADTEQRLDLTLPTPIFIEAKNADGSSAGRVSYVFAGENGILSSSGPDGSFVLEPITRNGTLYLADENREFGSVATITPAMVGKTQRFVLKPTGRVAITLLDANGKPVVGEPVNLSLRGYDPDNPTSHNTQGIDTAMTDANGRAALHVAPGKIPVVLTLPGNFERPTATGRGFLDQIEKELDLKPDESFDFGTIKLRKVFSEEPEIHRSQLQVPPKETGTKETASNSAERSIIDKLVQEIPETLKGEELREKIGKDAADAHLKALAEVMLAAKRSSQAVEVALLMREETKRDSTLEEIFMRQCAAAVEKDDTTMLSKADSTTVKISNAEKRLDLRASVLLKYYEMKGLDQMLRSYSWLQQGRLDIYNPLLTETASKIIESRRKNGPSDKNEQPIAAEIDKILEGIGDPLYRGMINERLGRYFKAIGAEEEAEWRFREAQTQLRKSNDPRAKAIFDALTNPADAAPSP